jgi:drug/metabolite transporter (DMT)-like permease
VDTRATPQSKSDPTRGKRLGFLALVAGAAGIATAPIFVRLSEAGPSATAGHRVLLALPFLACWASLERRDPNAPPPPRARRDFLFLALAGLLFALDLALWHWAIKLTSVANSTLLANTAALFVTLGAWLCFGERIHGRFLLALVLAFGGMALLAGASFQFSSRHLLGDALAVGAAMFYGGYQLCVARLRRRFSTAPIMVWSGLACAPVLFALAAASRETLVAETPHGWLVLAGLALISQVAGQSLIAYGFKHLRASFASLTLLFQPVVATGLAWGLFDERLRWQQWLGGAVVLGAIALASRTRAD